MWRLVGPSGEMLGNSFWHRTSSDCFYLELLRQVVRAAPGVSETSETLRLSPVFRRRTCGFGKRQNRTTNLKLPSAKMLSAFLIPLGIALFVYAILGFTPSESGGPDIVGQINASGLSYGIIPRVEATLGATITATGIVLRLRRP